MATTPDNTRRETIDGCARIDAAEAAFKAAYFATSRNGSFRGALAAALASAEPQAREANEADGLDRLGRLEKTIRGHIDSVQATKRGDRPDISVAYAALNAMPGFVAEIRAIEAEICEALERLQDRLDAASRPAPAPVAETAEPGLVERLKEAARGLAEYSSYAEIVRAVSKNAPQIRAWCDTVFEVLRDLEKAEDRAAEAQLAARTQPPEIAEALEPFAKRASFLEPDWLGHESHWHPSVGHPVTVDHLRHAKATYERLLASTGSRQEPAVLPCDVLLPPNTKIAKGCTFETLRLALQLREGRSAADLTFAFARSQSASLTTLETEIDEFLAQFAERESPTHQRAAVYFLKQARAALRSQPASRDSGEAMREWQPVSTAPTGRKILYRNGFNEVGHCRWWQDASDEAVCCWWDEESDRQAHPVWWMEALPDPIRSALPTSHSGSAS